MPNYNGDGTNIGFIGSSADNSISLDWLDNGLNKLGSTALKGYDTYYKVKTLSKSADDQIQQNYQNSKQAVGSKNLISGIDNNYVLLGIAGVVAFIIIAGG